MFKLNCWTRGWDVDAAPQPYKLIFPVSDAEAAGVLSNIRDHVVVK